MTGTPVAIVGAAETDEIGVLPTHSTLQLHVEGARNALADAGLALADIDGIASVSAPGPIQVAHALGITPRWIDGTGVGGTSFLLHVRHAVAAIQAGHASTVLITHGESGRSRVGASRYAPAPSSPNGQFEAPYGTFGPTTTFTIPLLRYMKEFGLTPEQLASVPVAQRKWAARNPRAMHRELITVEDVLESRLISYPFHLLECCLVTDGGGALVVTSADRAADLRKPPVHVLGTGETFESPLISQMADFTTSAAFRRASRDAFAEAGITPADVDHVMIYDAFAHVPIYGLEDMGFVGRGEAGPFIAEGHTSPGGSLPLNTNGGGLSYTHTGMYGMFLIQESVRQLRGEAAAQVDGVEISVALGNGGMFMAAGALVLGAALSRQRQSSSRSEATSFPSAG
ncbi:MAG TPA: thiolase [Pseudonocardiaceae bacterium]|jgi:acetyl-CoA acetyltransferase|nr:thiolase [Pseudonocardiaceae bacterium]